MRGVWGVPSCWGPPCRVTYAAMDAAELRAKIRDVKDFPTEGILFKDITTLLKEGPEFRWVVDAMAKRHVGSAIDVVVGIE